MEQYINPSAIATAIVFEFKKVGKDITKNRREKQKIPFRPSKY